MARTPIRALWPRAALAILFAVRPLASQAPAPAAPDDDSAVILELGAQSSWTTSGGATVFAPELAAEITPIENLLELEAGVSPYFTAHSTEWDTYLLFKKPWTISSGAEWMLGAGPQWAHTRANGSSTNTIAAEVAADFMFWPRGQHHYGWYVEPAYDYTFSSDHPHSLSFGAGLLLGVGHHRSR